jgi:regulator of replication initiation timing
MDGRELRIFNERTMDVQFLRRENQWLRRQRDDLQVQLFDVDQQFADLQERCERLAAENDRLRRQVDELRAARVADDAAEAKAAAETSPPLAVKPSVRRRRRKKPGRKKGHPAALRPMPEQIDAHQDVPLPRDGDGRPSCPACHACLLEVEQHERIVEDIIPEKVLVTCYHTASGWCPGCRKRVESRAREQPPAPAANIPHGQLGLNALATGVLLRIKHRLPFREVTGVLADLPGITVCAGAITRQVQRIAHWLKKDYEALMLDVRASPTVYADETGWRTDGRNGQLWAIATPTRTFYHIDKSRAGRVIRKLLGKAFGGTLVSDFYSAYAAMKCAKQKCLLHLLRELAQSAEKHPAFAASAFFRETKRLVKQMLRLKKRWDELSDERYTSGVCRLESSLDELIAAHAGRAGKGSKAADAAKTGNVEPNARRLARRMRRHRKELTAFLWDKDLEGTNNLAERAIRPAVVARKISGGSRSKKGADAFAKLASLLRTAGQQGKNTLATIKAMLVAAWETGNPAVVPRG